ncbi:MBOAT family O-acyltransferase [Magnetococcus sp. PR-3]|uniref:MBOAT family O-acyltransferase n=1 Tax=Magnetococcus sp. PR-3 TaxID=3120355 RepID=UPI002FCE32B2
MIFHSFDFILFLMVVLSGYWLLGRRAQNLFLLAASYFFYGYIHPWFLNLILISTVTDYFCGLGMARHPHYKRWYLIISLVINLGMLAIFKYFGFFVENVQELLVLAGLPSFSFTLEILLPVGISFYTFQTLSYTIDIYRGTLKPRRNFLDMALFVAFFPQLVAGPIERAKRLLPQIEQTRTIDVGQFTGALMLMAWGFFKKLVIADNVAVLVDKVFAVEDPSFTLLWAGVFAFAIQIFCDFSAYSDIARATARLLGFELSPNFNHPYLAVSPSDFWRRWHMSLSYWIRDYVYIALGGSQAKPLRAAVNLMITFSLCGLWHGASWNFVIWGTYHGLLILLYRGMDHFVPTSWHPPKVIQILVMFMFTNIGWLIFREGDLGYLMHDLTLTPFGESPDQRLAGLYILFTVFLYSLPIWLHALWARWHHRWMRSGLWQLPGIPYYLATSVLLFLISILHAERMADFIYFQF